jgi:hypothetical protein
LYVKSSITAYRTSRVATSITCVHAIAITPAESSKLYLLLSSDGLRPASDSLCPHLALTTSVFPVLLAGRLPTTNISRPLSVHSRYGLHTRGPPLRGLYILSSEHFVASMPYRIATGWNNIKLPGGHFSPLDRCAFPRRTITIIFITLISVPKINIYNIIL